MSAPPGWLSQMMGGGEAPGPEQEAAARRFEQAVADNGVREREALLRWQALFCTCLPYYTRPDLQTPPGHAACLVHGQFMLAHDGRVL